MTYFSLVMFLFIGELLHVISLFSTKFSFVCQLYGATCILSFLYRPFTVRTDKSKCLLFREYSLCCLGSFADVSQPAKQNHNSKQHLDAAIISKCFHILAVAISCGLKQHVLPFLLLSLPWDQLLDAAQEEQLA